MTSLSAQVRLRPTRIGFLVDPTDFAAVRQSMNVCTCLWGGVYNPIIPVCSAIPEQWSAAPLPTPNGEALAKGYIRFFEPDVFVEARPGLSANLGIGAVDLELGHKRVLPLSAMLEEPSDRRDNPPAGLSVFGLYRSLYDQEFKFVARHDHRVARCKATNTADAAFVDAAYGDFPKTGMLAPLSNSYEEAFEPKSVKATAKTWQKALTDGYRFPLSIGRHGIERAPSGGLGEPILFIADPSSALDLIDLWNIRLFRPNVIAVNARWFIESSKFIGDFIKRNHRPLPGNTHGVMISTTMEFGRSIGDARAKAMVEEAGLASLPSGSWSFKLWYDPIWGESTDDFVWRPQRAFLSAGSEDLDLTVSESDRERSVRFRGLAPDFASSYHNSSSAWVNVLQFRSYGSHSDLALSLPTDYDPGRTHHLRIGGVILPSREGLVLPQHFKAHGEYLRLLTGREAMTDWLKQHGLGAAISKAGRVTEQVLGALDGLRGIRLLADRETIQLLDRMAKSVRKYSDGTVEEYQDRTAAATVWSALVAKRSKDLWSRNISLDQYVERHVLKLGLGVQCIHCANVNWYSISELGEIVVCDRCRKTYPFPQGSIGFSNSPWKFRVVGPFSVPDYAGGAYATALTLRIFAETLSGMGASVVYAPGLDLTPTQGSPIEVDFALWYRRESLGHDEGETVTVFGETKSFGLKCFHAEDVVRMRQIAESFPGAFLVFAAMKDQLHDEEKAAIAGLASWGREPLDGGRPRAPVIVLTGVELFSPWRVDDTWKGLDGLRKKLADAGHVRLDNLWALADATQQIYLGLPSRSEELRRKWEAMRATEETTASTLHGSGKKRAAVVSARRTDASRDGGKAGG